MTGDSPSTDDVAQSDPTIRAPDVVRRDDSFEPRVTGLEPGARVDVVCETSDREGDWRSSATFEADDDGIVDLATVAPEAGSYDRVDPMGLVWSLAPTDPDAARAFEWTPTGSHDLQFAVRPADGDSRTDPLATTTVTVRHSDPAISRHDPDDSDGSGYGDAWYEPAGDGPHPAVVVLHGSGGRSMEPIAALLASEGYATYALRYLGTDDLPDRPMEVPLERVRRAIEWFRGHDAVSTDAYALYGVSMGAQLALQVAVRDDDVDAVVLDSPGHVRFFGAGTGAWTEDGDVLPYVDRRAEPPETFQYDVDGTPSGRGLFTQMLDAASAGERQAATIPVEDASADLLALSGSDDELWPATTFGNMLLARLDVCGYEHDYEHDVFHRAGHAIGVPHAPTTFRPAADDAPVASGGTPEAAASAAADAWPRVLAHLDDAR